MLHSLRSAKQLNSNRSFLSAHKRSVFSFFSIFCSLCWPTSTVGNDDFMLAAAFRLTQWHHFITTWVFWCVRTGIVIDLTSCKRLSVFGLAFIIRHVLRTFFQHSSHESYIKAVRSRRRCRNDSNDHNNETPKLKMISAEKFRPKHRARDIHVKFMHRHARLHRHQHMLSARERSLSLLSRCLLCGDLIFRFNNVPHIFTIRTQSAHASTRIAQKRCSRTFCWRRIEIYSDQLECSLIRIMCTHTKKERRKRISMTRKRVSHSNWQLSIWYRHWRRWWANERTNRRNHV